MFQSTYSMRVHQRSCSYQDQPMQKKRNVEIRKKTGSTIETSKVSIVSSFPYDVDVEEVSNIVRALNDKDGIGCEKLTDEERLLTSAMLMMAKTSRKVGRGPVDSLIKMIINPLFPTEKFRISCQSITDCIHLENDIVSKNFLYMGYQRQIVLNDEKTIQCEMYMRSPIEVLSKQINAASASTTMFNFPHRIDRGEKIFHPMNADLGRIGETVVKQTVMSNLNSGGMWHQEGETREQSFAGMVQLYSDKSRTSLKESSFQFYPIHINLLNFAEQHRRKCIVEGKTVLAFLPVKFFAHGRSEHFEINLGRRTYLSMLHKCMALALNEVKSSGLEGFPCEDNDGVLRRCHPVIASYCSDLPECKDILPVKNGNSSKRNCHRCLAETKSFNDFTSISRRDGSKTVSTILKSRDLRSAGKIDAAESLLSEYSLIDMIPFLQGFPFLGKHPVLDMHIMFSYEPLHNLYLGISKLLKVCLSERLKSTSHHTSSILTRAGNRRTTSFRNVRMTILMGINKMLSHLQMFSPLQGTRIDFSKGGSSGNEKGVYGSDGNLIGMLEGKDYRNLDVVFPFVGMFVDRLCDETSTAVSTKVFARYVDMLQTCLNKKSREALMGDDTRIRNLEQQIRVFKKMATKLYGPFHASKLGTEKMHMLDHIPDDIRRLGSLQFNDAGLYEYSHTIVKNAHKATSGRKHSAMAETISAYVKDVVSTPMIKESKVNELHPFVKRSAKNQREFPKALCVAIKEDCATLVRSGKLISVSEIERVRRIVRRKRIATMKNDTQEVEKLKLLLESTENRARELVEDIGETASRVLYQELLENISRICNVTQSISASMNIVRVASGYVHAINIPTSKNYVESMGKVVTCENTSRTSQRFVSTRGFYSRPGLRQDCVILQAPGTSHTGMVNVWFGKVLGLFRVRSNGELASGMESTENLEQFAFVQFFDILPLEDEIEKALGCIRLRWARGDSYENHNTEDAHLKQEKERKWFTLLPVSTIRGVAHIVRGDYGIGSAGTWKDMEDVPWEDQFFYVNRFEFDSEGIQRGEQ